MTCQQEGCTRRGELACMVGEVRKVLCIEHQARYRQAQSCGGRTITIHHGVDLEDWSRPTVRRAAPVEDTPNLGLPHSKPEIVPLYSLATVRAVPTPPPAPPVPPPTLKVIMNKPRPLCLWPGCNAPSLQGVCCKNHGDRYRSIYGTAAQLTEAQIAAGPELWDQRLKQRAAAKVKPVILEAPAVQPAPVVVTKVTEAKAPDVDTAKILLNLARKLSSQPDVQLVLEAAIMVLR